MKQKSTGQKRRESSRVLQVGASSHATSGDRAGETLIVGLLRQMARERAASLRWDTNIAITFYVLFGVVAILRLDRADIIVVTAVSALGLATLWVVARMRGRMLEKRLFQEEVESYSRIVSGESAAPASSEEETSGPEDAPLSRRELEVLSRIADGMSNKEIAVVLGISSQTVKNHIYHILTKLEVADRTSAALIGMSHGWISGAPRPADTSHSRVSAS